MKKSLKNTKNSIKALTLVEALLALTLVAGALFAYMYQNRQDIAKQNRDVFATDMVTVIKAIDQKVHVDGPLLKKPTNFEDDVTGRAGTQYEPSFWDTPDKTLMASAKTVSGKTLVYFDTNVPTVLNKLFVARKNNTCGAGDGWVPVPEKESKTALIPCGLWKSRVPFNMTPKLYLQYQTTAITPSAQSRTPSNTVQNDYLTSAYLTMQFKTAAEMKGKYASIADILDRLDRVNRDNQATGTMDYYFALTTSTSGDANAAGLDVKVSPLACYASAANCVIVGRWRLKGGEENLRLDGMNSMVASEITFKLGDKQSSQKAMCKRFTKTADENTNQTVPGLDTAAVPNAPWIFEENIPCGIGMIETEGSGGHSPAADNLYSVTTLSGSSNFKGLTLDRQCNNFDLNGDGLIYNLSTTTPCGIIHNTTGGVDQIILYTNEIQAQEGIFGDGTGSGDGTIHSRTVMIQENAILNDLNVAGNFNAENSLHVIGTGAAFTFANDNTWKTQLSQMLTFCSTVTSGAKTTNAVLAGCKTLNSGNLNVGQNIKIQGLLQVDGVLYQGAQNSANAVSLTGNVVMGSNVSTSANATLYKKDNIPENESKTGTRDVYKNTSDSAELNTLCVGHDLLQGEDSCAPSSNLTGTDGNVVIQNSGDTNNPNWLTVGGKGGKTGPRYDAQSAVFTIMQNGVIRKSTTASWNGSTYENAISNTNSNDINVRVHINNNNNLNPMDYKSISELEAPTSTPDPINSDTKDSSTGQVYSFWAHTLLPTGLGQQMGNSCTSFQLGTIVQDSNTGDLLSCIQIGSNKLWSRKSPFANGETLQSSSTVLGQWQLCTLTTLGALKNSGTCALTPTAVAGSDIIKTWRLTNRARCQATCFGNLGAGEVKDDWSPVTLSCGYYNTPDHKPKGSENENATDAELGWVGGTASFTSNDANASFPNPPKNDKSKAYSVSNTYNCTAWTPLPNTIPAGTTYTQTRTCSQDFQQQCYIYEKNQYSDVRIKNTGSAAFANSSTAGNLNSFTSTVTETQSAIGTMPVIQ